MDLKIASIALIQDALLVTANLRDFSIVPGLRCENWLVLLFPLVLLVARHFSDNASGE
jgi:hypothetical protein